MSTASSPRVRPSSCCGRPRSSTASSSSSSSSPSPSCLRGVRAPLLLRRMQASAAFSLAVMCMASVAVMLLLRFHGLVAPSLVAVGLSNQEIGVLLAAANLAFIPGKVLLSPAVDRINTAVFFAAILTVSGAATLLFGLVPYYYALIVFLVVLRFLLGSAWSALLQVIRRRFPESMRSPALSAISIAFTVGGALAPLIIGALISALPSWAEVVVVIGALTLGVAGVFALVVRSRIIVLTDDELRRAKGGDAGSAAAAAATSADATAAAADGDGPPALADGALATERVRRPALVSVSSTASSVALLRSASAGGVDDDASAGAVPDVVVTAASEREQALDDGSAHDGSSASVSASDGAAQGAALDVAAASGSIAASSSTSSELSTTAVTSAESTISAAEPPVGVAQLPRRPTGAAVHSAMSFAAGLVTGEIVVELPNLPLAPGEAAVAPGGASTAASALISALSADALHGVPPSEAGHVAAPPRLSSDARDVEAPPAAPLPAAEPTPAKAVVVADPRAMQAAESVRELLRDLQLWLLVLFSICITAFMEIEVVAPLMITQMFAIAPSVAPFVAAASPIGTFVSLVLTAIIEKRTSPAGVRRAIFIITLLAPLSLVYLLVAVVIVDVRHVAGAAAVLFFGGLGGGAAFYYPISVYAMERGGSRYAGALSGIVYGVGIAAASGFDVVVGELTGGGQWLVPVACIFGAGVLTVVLLALIYFGPLTCGACCCCAAAERRRRSRQHPPAALQRVPSVAASP